jgi:hypothetical protein
MAAVDGRALSTSVLGQVSEPNVTFERDELQKKLDKKEIDLTRKEKELHKCELEVFRLQKEAKLAGAENQNLRERNETLQQSLMNARLLSQSARDEASNAQNENRIRELESALSAAIHKIKKGEVELNTWQQKWKDTDNMAQEVSHELQTIKTDKSDDKETIATLNAKLKAANALQNKTSDMVDNLNQEMMMQNQRLKETQDKVERKQMEVDASTRAVAEANAETQKLKTVLQVRSETNSALRSQLEEISGNTFTITKEEMKKYQSQEMELKQEKSKHTQTNRSLDLHMDLLHKAEIEATEAVEKMQKAEVEVSKLNMQLFEMNKRVGSTSDRERVLKKEIIKLRKQSKEQEAHLKELELDPHSHDEEVMQMRQALAGTNKSRLDELENKQKEAKRRKIAEESLSALRNRIAFLLEQLEAASSMANKWQQQKAILRSEVESLQNINTELRKRLTIVQAHYVNRGIGGLVEGDAFGESKTELFPSAAGSMAMSPYGKSTHHRSGAMSPRGTTMGGGAAPSAGDVLSGRAGAPTEALGEYYQHPAASAVVGTVESFVERALFDTICAFSSGAREHKISTRKGGASGFKKSKGKVNQKPIFKVQPVKDQANKYEVVSLGSNDDSVDTAANELLVATHINSFLNFCQSRSAEKAASLYSEKIAHLLNFMHHSEQDMIEQLANSRMEQAQLSSKVATNDNRVNRLRVRYSSERTAKQKTIMKVIREQMRLSDVRLLFNDTVEKSRDVEGEMISNGLSMQSELQSTMHLMQQVGNIAEELSRVGAGNTDTAEVGAMELRLPDCELDDESLFSAMGLLSGGLEDASAMRTMQPLQLEGGETTTNNMIDPDNPMPTTGHMVMSAELAKNVANISKDYLARVIMLNLRGNLLTDISCKTLSPLIERSGVLRFVDLRDNAITEKGAKMLFDSSRKNRSIMYVTQRQNGYMIEGHREIGPGRSGGGGNSSGPPDSDNPNFSMRIDVRGQEAKVGEVSDYMFEQVDHSFFRSRHPEAFEPGAGGGGRTTSPGSTWGMNSPGPGGTYPGSSSSPGRFPDSPRGATRERQDENKVTWGATGLISQLEGELAQRKVNPSAVVPHALNDLNFKITEADRIAKEGQKPPRPQSASASLVSERGDLRIGMGSRNDAATYGGGGGYGLDLDDGGSVTGGGGSIIVASPRGAMRQDKTPGGNADLIDLIESGARDASDNVGGLVDSKLRKGGNIGSVLDGQIRDMEQRGQVEPGNVRAPGLGLVDSPYDAGDALHVGEGSGDVKKKKKKVSVKTRILTDTKRIYNNKKAFGDMGIEEEGEKLRKAASAKNAKNEPTEVSNMMGTIPQPLDKGGGQASRNAASSVQRKLSADRERAKTASSSRPGSARAGSLGTPSKQSRSHGHKQLSTLQKLNPSTLF